MIEDNTTPLINPNNEAANELVPIDSTPEQRLKIANLTDGLVQMALQEQQVPGWDAKYTVAEQGGLDVEFKQRRRGGSASSLHIHRGGGSKRANLDVDVSELRIDPKTQNDYLLSQHISIGEDTIMGTAKETPATIMITGDIRKAGEGNLRQPSSATDLEQTLESFVDLRNAPTESVKKHWWQRKR